MRADDKRLPPDNTRQNAPAPVRERVSAPVPVQSPGRPSYEYISYSANFEDVILHRIFAGRPLGFYIDVGAAHPTYENDTKLLYDSGWHGINVEPNEAFFNALKSERTRDRNFCVALADQAGTLTYYDVIGTGLSTCALDLANRARDKGHQVVEKQVAVTTLARLLDEVKPSSIELLKIDVEGFEEKVLAGNDWSKYRPSVILVEATYPESSERRPSGVRAYLEERGYRWRYFDGLNDFYVGEDFEVPEGAFDRPPNVFDHFRLRTVVDLENGAAGLKSKIGELENVLSSKTVELDKIALDRDHIALDRDNIALDRDNIALERERILTKLNVAEAAVQRSAAILGVVAHHAAQSIAAGGLKVADIFDDMGNQLSDSHMSTPMPQTFKHEAGQPNLASDESKIFADTVLHAAAKSLQDENERLKNELQDEKFERRTLAKAVTKMRQEMVQFSRELEKAHRDAEELARMRSSLAQFESDKAALNNQYAALNNQYAALNHQFINLGDRYQAILASTSWTITAPLRAVGRLLKR